MRFENIEVSGFRGALRGMRNPLGSWAKSDTVSDTVTVSEMDALIVNMAKKYEKSGIDVPEGHNDWYDYLLYNCILNTHKKGNTDLNLFDIYLIGPNDYTLAKKLASQGVVHGKYLRMIFVTVDITAPVYFWSELDTYKVATVRDSTSIQYLGAKREYSPSNFTLDDDVNDDYSIKPLFNEIIDAMNMLKQQYNDTKDYGYFRQMRQIMPMGINYKSTWSANYATLQNIYKYRRGHKLSEWNTEFMQFIDELPYTDILIKSITY